MTTSTPPQPYTEDRLKNSTTSVDANLRLSSRNQAIDFLKCSIEVARRELQCALERKIEHTHGE